MPAFPRRSAVPAGRRRPRAAAAIVVALALVATGAASGFTLLRVHSGDTLGAIAARYHTSVSRLVALNHLPGHGDLIYAGQVLRVPRPVHARPRVTYRTVTTTYVVRPGDSLYAIAARQHVSAKVIAKRNHLPRSLMVLIGQRLAVPHRVRVTSTSHAAAATTRSAVARSAQRHRAQLNARAVPSRTAVASMIRTTARHWGVDPRLALAISWQESGFNQREVSGVDAIGAMQVLPGTGEWVAANVVHRRLNLLNARDNVTAGVALLAVLTRESHHTKLAVAGYYQGLASVQSRGMYADTKQYVANVLALRNRFRP